MCPLNTVKRDPTHKKHRIKIKEDQINKGNT